MRRHCRRFNAVEDNMKPSCCFALKLETNKNFSRMLLEVGTVIVFPLKAEDLISIFGIAELGAVLKLASHCKHIQIQVAAGVSDDEN